MRRLLTLAAFFLLCYLPMSAQRGGGRGSIGGHGGSFGHFSGGHGFGGMHSGGGIRFSGGFGGGHFHGGGFGGRGFHHHFRGFGYPWYPGYGYGFYDPIWWSDSYSAYDYDQERDRAIADEENALNLREQNLRQREDWRRSRNSEDQDAYAHRAPSRSQPPAKPDPATLLVFRDQHRQEISNYAIAGGTLWVLSEQSAKKIPLADLDLEATAKINDERGVEFQIPK